MMNGSWFSAWILFRHFKSASNGAWAFSSYLISSSIYEMIQRQGKPESLNSDLVFWDPEASSCWSMFIWIYFPPLPNPEQGVYEFPRLTLLGFDTNEPQVKRLTQLGLKVLPFCTTPYHLVVRMNLFGSTPFKTHFLNSFLHKLLWTLDCHLSFRCHKPLTAGTSCD